MKNHRKSSKMCRFFSIFLFFLNFLNFSHISCKIITTSYGSINGSESENSKFHTFKKIPFAVPPLGKLRFQKPQKSAKWSDLIDGTEYGDGCPSHTVLSSSPPKTMSEDCLYMNIFTSDYCIKKKSCEVIFYIHGGAMFYDSAIMFNETVLWRNFVSKDIVFVIPAYRLGIYSHFTVSDQNVAPANLFMYDILLAMDFSHSEIHNFGGNPSKTTLFGHSAGAGLINLMLFSPTINADKKYFQRVISMSIDIPVRERANYEKLSQFTKDIAELAGCLSMENSDNSTTKIREIERKMMECMQKVPDQQLLDYQSIMDDRHKFFIFVIPMPPFFGGKQSDELFRFPKNIDYLCGMEVDEYVGDTLYMPLGEIFGYDNGVEVEEKYRRDWEMGRLAFNVSDETIRQKMSTYMPLKRLADFGATPFLYEYGYRKHTIHRESAAMVLGIHDFEKDENEAKLAEIYPKLFVNFVKTGRPGGRDYDWAPYSTLLSNFFDINWNSSDGTVPRQKFGWERQMIEYFFDELISYDKEISDKREKLTSWRKRPTTLISAVLTLVLARMI